MKEKKPFCDYSEQLEILKSKGCIIEDEKLCNDYLSNVGYYRLKAYCLPFKQKDGSYNNSFSFHRVSRLYDFDKKLRGILFPVIETIEISLRARLVLCYN